MLTSLPTCFCFEDFIIIIIIIIIIISFIINVLLIYSVILQLLSSPPLTLGVRVQCLVLPSGGFRFPLKKGMLSRKP